MKTIKHLALISLSLFLYNCGEKENKESSVYALEIPNDKKTYTLNDRIELQLKNEKNQAFDSVVYYMNDQRLEQTNNTIQLKGQKLGHQQIVAKVYAKGKVSETTKELTILSPIRPKLYTYKILESYPHDIKAYTQGLEFHGDVLYESTGQYNQSSLRKTDYKTGEVLQQVNLARQFFGEGLTIMNSKIFQLTWQEKTGFIYDLETLEQKGTFVYGKSKEGWGLCNDGKTIYKSDGTDRIWSLNPNTLAEKDYIQIYTNTSKIKSVNELEWVDGKIYANIYMQGSIAIIDPASGAVEGVIDLTDLKDYVTQHPQLDVLNGIAYKGEKNILYITGKNWDKLFKIEILEK